MQDSTAAAFHPYVGGLFRLRYPPRSAAAKGFVEKERNNKKKENLRHKRRPSSLGRKEAPGWVITAA